MLNGRNFQARQLLSWLPVVMLGEQGSNSAAGSFPLDLRLLHVFAGVFEDMWISM